MTEKKDMYAEAKSQLRLYKEKELRRESDKLIRNHLYQKLSAAKNTLKNIFQKLSDRRYFDILTDMDRLVAKMDRVVEKMNHASYGYTGFFDVVKVKEAALDRMIDFDNKLIDDVNNYAAEVDAFKAELASGETKNLKTRIEALTDKLEGFEDTFDQRDEVIRGVN